MNTLVKKEIRLLLPSWIAAVLLAMVQGFARPYDSYVASLLFFGLTVMALTTVGRETSLNTFSSLLAQPTERILVWKTKLAVLAVAFLTVCGVWLAAYTLAYHRNYAEVGADMDLKENSHYLFMAVCLIATATFTGGLWTTLLLRQLAGAFWLTLLVPVTLSAIAGLFLANSDSGSLVIAVLSVVIGVYSLTGFLFARRLFFRAQDVGWSGGVITLPEWKFLSAREGAGEMARTRKPLLALVKKEIQLQQGVLTGAAGLAVLHAGIIGLRVVHKFSGNSVGEVLTSVFWIMWLVLPALLGSMAVAEERKLGVMESQLCLPVSRRRQFVVKAGVTLALGIFLGGVMPILLESFGWALNSPSLAFTAAGHVVDKFAVLSFLFGTMAFSGGLALATLFASSLAKNFLQAVSIGLVTFIVMGILVPAGLTRLT
jgi:hypothetical protein